MAESVEEFLARGGKVDVVEAGARAMSDRDLWLRAKAPDTIYDKVIGKLPAVDFTDESMRHAENMGTLDVQAYRQELMRQ